MNIIITRSTYYMYIIFLTVKAAIFVIATPTTPPSLKFRLWIYVTVYFVVFIFIIYYWYYLLLNIFRWILYYILRKRGKRMEE